jgi:hypothetical protein
VDASAVASEKAKTAHQELLDSFAGVVTSFSSTPNDEILQKVPQLIVSEFQALRAELWLWDETSNSLYLTHCAGQKAEHRRDYIPSGIGVLGGVSDT